MILSSAGQSEKESTGITHFQIDLLWDEILYCTVQEVCLSIARYLFLRTACSYHHHAGKRSRTSQRAGSCYQIQ
jgi:hypothetical protein